MRAKTSVCAVYLHDISLSNMEVISVTMQTILVQHDVFYLASKNVQNVDILRVYLGFASAYIT